jgi:hypothetical protein
LTTKIYDYFRQIRAFKSKERYIIIISGDYIEIEIGEIMAIGTKRKVSEAQGAIAGRIVSDLIDRAYSKRSWHGANLAGSLRGLSVQQAIWRPSKNRHNIWELTIHSAYWKYIVWRKLANRPDSKFAMKGSDWIKSPERPSEKEWKKAKSIFGKYHKLLQEAIRELAPAKLYLKMPDSKLQYIDIVLGVAAHDLYHAGQIQILKRFQK